MTEGDLLMSMKICIIGQAGPDTILILKKG